jgi:PAT family beta-lactamase induction signal transducer AmpG
LFTIITFFVKIDSTDALFPSLKTIKPKAVSESNPKLKEVFTNLWKGITELKSFRLFCVIAGAYTCFSIFIRSFNFHLIHELKWPDNQLSVMQGGWGSIITFAVVISGGVLADKIGAGKMLSKVLLVLCLFLLVFNSFSFLWINKTVSITGLLFWNLADPLLSVTSFPLLMALCRHDVEGSQFTAYMALINLCDVAGSFISGWGMRVISAPVLGFSCGLGLLTALVFLYRINLKAVSDRDETSLKAI